MEQKGGVKLASDSPLGPKGTGKSNIKLPSANVTLGPSNPWPFSGSGGNRLPPIHRGNALKPKK
jgi:hypothetical protein